MQPSVQHGSAVFITPLNAVYSSAKFANREDTEEDLVVSYVGEPIGDILVATLPFRNSDITFRDPDLAGQFAANEENRMSRNSTPWRLCTTNRNRSNSPPWLTRGAAKRRGGSFKKINLFTNTTPALRATPPQLLSVYPQVVRW